MMILMVIGFQMDGTRATEAALNEGLVDKRPGMIGARGPLDPRMPDSDLDGIMDGDEDFDSDGLNRTALLNRYCLHGMVPRGICHIDPLTTSGASFYDLSTNYTNYEEYENGTYAVYNDSDMCGDDRCPDGLLDGYEVFHKDSDGDTMWDGWEYSSISTRSTLAMLTSIVMEMEFLTVVNVITMLIQKTAVPSLDKVKFVTILP